MCVCVCGLPGEVSVGAHLKGELVLLLVCKGEALADHVTQVVLHKLHGLGEALLHLIPRCAAVVIAKGAKKTNPQLPLALRLVT